MTKIICIVDAYSTGKQLAAAFKQKGYTCIHIKSASTLPTRYQHRTGDFIDSLNYNQNIDELLTQLKHFGEIHACIPGYESGVKLADLISERLILPTNGSSYSELRRNKYAMSEAVKAAGLTTTPHTKSSHYADIEAWADNQWQSKLAQPIVLKPLESANGDHVFFCHDRYQLEDAFTKITASTNQFGQANLEVLAEGLNAGTEYIINTVSWEGQHYVVEMCRIVRKPNTTIYDTAEVMRPQDEEWSAIEIYTFKVLDALKIQHGAGTTELKYTPENGPILLETSGRLMGNYNLAFFETMASVTQLSLLVEAYDEPQKFLKRIQSPRPPQNYHGMDVLLISNHQGILSVDIETQVKALNLKSYHSGMCLEKGQMLQITTHQDSTPGEVFLLHQSPEVLREDYHKIRTWEENFYKTAVLLEASKGMENELFVS